MFAHTSRTHKPCLLTAGTCVVFSCFFFFCLTTNHFNIVVTVVFTSKQKYNRIVFFLNFSHQFDGVHVVSGSLDTSIRVWDAITGTCKHTLMGHQSLTSGMELRQNILVSGNADSTVKVWDTTNGQCLQTLSGKCQYECCNSSIPFSIQGILFWLL